VSAPLVVNTTDGTVWTRREGSRGGEALYAPEKCGQCPQFVMATLTELAEHGIAGSADVLPVPVGTAPLAPQGRARTMLDHAREALNARMTKDALRLVLENVVTYAASLEARLAEYERPTDEDPIRYTLTEQTEAGPCRNESPYGRRCDRPAGHDGDHEMADGAGGHFGWPASDEDVTPQVAKLRALLAGQREQAGGPSC
jgi:hypothetical protein